MQLHPSTQTQPTLQRRLPLLHALLPWRRLTVAIWTCRYRDLLRAARRSPLADAAVHVVLADLQRCPERSALLTRYAEPDRVDDDFALVAALVPGDLGSALWWQVRDAAYHLRWQQLAGPACST